MAESHHRVQYIITFVFGTAFGAVACFLVWYGNTTWRQLVDDNRIKDRLQRFTFDNAAVAADNKICSDIGRDILQGTSTDIAGSAADAAIAAMICTSVVNCHSSGIGGGHFSVAYNRVSGNVSVVDAREKAPMAAYRDMFKDNPAEAKKGGLAIAVPGEVKGFYELWKLHGRLEWSSLFEPSIQLARQGFKIGGALAFAIQKNEDSIKNNTSLWEIFTDDEGELLKEGDMVKLPRLANTLQEIAINGTHMSFYNGRLAATIAEEIRKATPENKLGLVLADLQSYDISVEQPLRVQYGKLTMFSPQPPASGALLSFILNLLEGYYLTPCSKSSNTDCNRPLQYHRFVEIFKFAYAGRGDLKDKVDPSITEQLISKEYADMIRHKITDDRTHLPSYYGEDSLLGLYEEGGTAHVSVIDQYGNAVAISSSINKYFGSLVLGEDTGIFYNNQMDDFAFNVTPLPANIIAPGRRPLSSMVPCILVDNTGQVRVVAGGAGSLSILTATALVISNTLWFEDDVFMASDRPRLHYPGRELYKVTYEEDVTQDIIEGLEERDII
ncbi:glutathione hydrolase 1 proenzyme-like [Amphiura filiformis]|uniref:glutathione hydrolase 1 proenzyme-like n=1 Tax=Amphiura filiformis TaxID=82378 RepID=UPI003B228E31